MTISPIPDARRLVIAICVLGGIAHAGPPSAPITAGVVDDGDGEIAALLGDGRLVCTGTLIAPRIVLTAGHCIGLADQVLFGSSVSGGESRDAVYQVAAPGFRRGESDADLGLILLDAPASAVPARLPPPDLSPIDIGQPIRIVGFGLTMSDADADPPSKRQGTSMIATVDDSSFSFSPGPSQTCAGDSGGPAFVTVEGVEYLIGVTSAGDILCDRNATDVRVDRNVASFVQPFVDAVAHGAEPRGCRSPDPDACPASRGCDAGTGGAGGLLVWLIAALAVRSRHVRRGQAWTDIAHAAECCRSSVARMNSTITP